MKIFALRFARGYYDRFFHLRCDMTIERVSKRQYAIISA
jgi:hypothetical protein